MLCSNSGQLFPNWPFPLRIWRHQKSWGGLWYPWHTAVRLGNWNIQDKWQYGSFLHCNFHRQWWRFQKLYQLPFKWITGPASGRIRLSISTASRTSRKRPTWHPSVCTYFIRLGSVTTNRKKGLTGEQLAVGTDSQSVSTGSSRMFSLLTEGCHVGYSREFVGTVDCAYGQSNTASAPQWGWPGLNIQQDWGTGWGQCWEVLVIDRGWKSQEAKGGKFHSEVMEDTHVSIFRLGDIGRSALNRGERQELC